MLPPTRTYSEKNTERSIDALLRTSFTRIMYQRVEQNPRYIVRNTKIRDRILLFEAFDCTSKH